VLGPYRYFCPVHGESDPFTWRSQADRFGHEHRNEYHAGMHPPGGECTIGPDWRAPRGGERSAIIAFVVVMLLAIVSQWL
jgi:hypothetical protein